MSHSACGLYEGRLHASNTPLKQQEKLDFFGKIVILNVGSGYSPQMLSTTRHLGKGGGVYSDEMSKRTLVRAERFAAGGQMPDLCYRNS